MSSCACIAASPVPTNDASSSYKFDAHRKDIRALCQFIPKLADYGILVDFKLHKTFEIAETNDEIKTSGRLELVSGNKFHFPSMAFPNNEGDRVKVWVQMRIMPIFYTDKTPEKETCCQITFWQQEFCVEKAECLSSIEIPLSEKENAMLWE